MELRSCRHMHFIQAIKNGLVIKSPSINYSRKSSLKFRIVKELYKTDEQNESSTLHLKNGYDGVNIECEFVSFAERKISAIDSEAFISKVSGDDHIGNCDDNFGDVTLKQLRERCKAKKRKLSNFLSLTEENVNSFSCTNHEQPEDELDLMVPLIRLKSKRSNKKAKECINQNICNVPQTAVSVVKIEELHDNEESQSCMELLNANIKDTVPFQDYSQSPNKSCSVDDCSFRCNESSGSSGLFSNEILEAGNGFVADSEVSNFSRKETLICSGSEVDVLCPDNSDSPNKNCLDVCSAGCKELEGSSGLILNEMLEATNSFVAESGGPICSREEPQNCIVDELPDAFMHEGNLSSYSATRAKSGDNREIISHQSLPMPSSGIIENCVVNEVSYKYVDQDAHNCSSIYGDNSETACCQSLPLRMFDIKEELIAHPLQCDIHQEAPIFTVNCSSDKIGCSQSSAQQAILFRINENPAIQVPDLTCNSGLEGVSEAATSGCKAEKLTDAKDFRSCMNVQDEIPCSDNTGEQKMFRSFDDCSLHCNELLVSSGSNSNQTFRETDGSVAESEDSTLTRKDAQNCTIEKAGVSFLDYANSPIAINHRDACSIGCNELLDSSLLPLNKTLEAVNGCVADSGHSVSSREEPQNCTVDEIPYTYVDQNQPTCSSFMTNNRENLNAGNLEITCSHSHSIHVSEKTIASCIVNEVSYESADRSQYDSFSNFWATSNRNMQMDNSESISHQILSLPLSKIKEKGDDTCPLPSDTYQEAQGFHVSHEIAFEISTNACNRIQEPRQKSMGVRYGSGPCEYRNSISGALPPMLLTGIISNSVGSSSSPHNPHSCLIEGNQSCIFANSIEPIKCSTESDAFGATNELTIPTLQHPPERLLSTRKTISPTSQERLCQAMKSVELDGEEKHKMLMRKLRFGQTPVTKASFVGSNLEATEVDISAKKDINSYADTVTLKQDARKSDIDKNGSHLKGILKIPQHSRAMQLNSIHGCSQSAIAFSQRQMRDMECLATKLTNQLKAMKGILEQQEHPEAYLAASSEDSADEVRMIINNATEAEKTTQRWLSMMARDCNRFCKLMRFADKDSGIEDQKDVTVPSNDAGKKKKITFADEVGQNLCHVKVFKYDAASLPLPLESKHGND